MYNVHIVNTRIMDIRSATKLAIIFEVTNYIIIGIEVIIMF